MKKTILRISIAGMLLLGALSMASAQTQPAAKKDSVNADKAAKPVFYNAASEEEAPQSNNQTIWFISTFVVVAGVAVVLLRKKKK